MTATINQKLLRETRENAGLSQEDLARMVGVAKNTIQRMETIEDYNVKPHLLGDVAEKLGLSTCKLISER